MSQSSPRRRSRARGWLLAAALGAFGESAARAGADCPSDCGEDLACAISAARCLLENGRPRQAISLLRNRRRQAPAEAHLILARAYFDDGNQSWALRVLHERVAAAPDDCTARSWAVWLHLERAELARARELLEERGCPGDWEPMRARWRLLAARLDEADGQTQRAALALDDAQRAGALFSEDVVAIRRQARQPDSAGPPPLSLHGELAGGWTSNGRLSSPTDPGGAGLGGSSPVTGLDLSGRLLLPGVAALRPALDAGLRGLLLGDGEVRSLSYLNPLVRPGLLLARGRARLLAAYAGSWLVLEGSDAYSDGPRLFYASHRGELELELGPRLTIFGGAGRSTFREMVRTRSEADLGAGAHLRLGRSSLLLVLLGRVHAATSDGYDLRGASALAAWQAPLGRGLSARASAVAALDDYPRSHGYFDTEGARRDLLLRVSASLYSPPWGGVQVGLGYDPSWRRSTAAAYSYVDHRVVVKVRWMMNSDPWGPRQLPAPGGVTLWGTGGVDAPAGDRIQDLLRQEDAARRSSSCVSR